jgi:hypothetical protein
MPIPLPLGPDAGQIPPSIQHRSREQCDLKELVSLAVRGLVGMFDPYRNLFCHRMLFTNRTPVREGISRRYTMISLLGLTELESSGANAPVDVEAIYAALARDTNWIEGIGDLGLLIWLTAKAQPERLRALLRTCDYETALGRYADAVESRTMELSWFLSGLAHAAEVLPELTGPLTDVSVETYHRLEENQGNHGLFAHLDPRNSLAGRLRGHIASFADQAYTIYAMCRFAKTFGVEDPLGPALECAMSICAMQGDLGEWWWLYDVHGGHVSSHYPVYSTHQYGVGPMALFAAQDVTGQYFGDFIRKGLLWIYGSNELGVDMRYPAHDILWRCQLPRKRQTKYWEMALNAVRSSHDDVQLGALKILHEQRPYEFGWLLYALCKREQSDFISANRAGAISSRGES